MVTYLAQYIQERGTKFLAGRHRMDVRLEARLVFIRSLRSRYDANLNAGLALATHCDLRSMTFAKLNISRKRDPGLTFQEGRFARALVPYNHELGSVS